MYCCDTPLFSTLTLIPRRHLLTILVFVNYRSLYCRMNLLSSVEGSHTTTNYIHRHGTILKTNAEMQIKPSRSCKAQEKRRRRERNRERERGWERERGKWMNKYIEVQRQAQTTSSKSRGAGRQGRRDAAARQTGRGLGGQAAIIKPFSRREMQLL